MQKIQQKNHTLISEECVARKLKPPFVIPGVEIPSSLTYEAAQILCRSTLRFLKFSQGKRFVL